MVLSIILSRMLFAKEGESISDTVLLIFSNSGSPRSILMANMCFTASIRRCSPKGPFTASRLP